MYSRRELPRELQRSQGKHGSALPFFRHRPRHQTCTQAADCLCISQPWAGHRYSAHSQYNIIRTSIRERMLLESLNSELMENLGELIEAFRVSPDRVRTWHTDKRQLR